MPAEISLQDVPVSTYDGSLLWELRDPSMKTILSGTIPHGTNGEVRFTPEAEGSYFLALTSGSCAYSITTTNIPAGLYAAEGLSLIQEAKRLYFYVPPETGAFTLSIKGQGSETARLNVFDPANQQVATVQTSVKQQTADATITPDNAGTYSLEVTRADEGVLEDYTITLDAKLPPTLSLIPEQVFQLTRTK